MPRYDDPFVDRFLEPWDRHDVDGVLALMTDDCGWEVTRTGDFTSHSVADDLNFALSDTFAPCVRQKFPSAALTSSSYGQKPDKHG